MAPLLLASSCDQERRLTVSAECAVFTPPEYEESDVDVISDRLAIWLRETVEKGERICGW